MPSTEERRANSAGFKRPGSGQAHSGRGGSSQSQRMSQSEKDEDSESELVDIVGDPDGEFLSDESDGEDDETHTPRRSRYDVVFMFELLWRTRKSSGIPNVWLPETIVIRNNQPTGWYFTHPLDGRIMKRNLGQEHFITQKKILEVFDGATGEVAAVFVNTIELDGKRVVDNTQYFDRQHLREFLYTEDPQRNGFLQKFVSIRQQRYGSAAQTNQTLQTLNVSWKRGDLRSTRVEQRVNFLRVIQAQRNGEGPGFSYARADTRSNIALAPQSHIVIKISEACQRIVDHCKATSGGAVRITRMKCCFKIGVKGILWLNQCSSVDIEDRPSRPPSTYRLHDQFVSHGGRLRSHEGSLHDQFMSHRVPDQFVSHGGRLRSHEGGLHDQFMSHRVPDQFVAHGGRFRSHEGGFERKRDASRDSMPQIVADRNGNAETWTARPVTESAFSSNDGKDFVDNVDTVSSSCAMCGCGTGPTSCSVTYGDINRILQLWAMRTKTDADRSNAGTANESGMTERGAGSSTSRLWENMGLSEQDKITLPDLRSRLYSLQVPDATVERLELQLASLDKRITGLIGHDLFSKAAELIVRGPKQQPTTALPSRKLVVADLDPTTLKLLDRILTQDEMDKYECLDFLEDVKSSHKPRSPKSKQVESISLMLENLRQVMPKRDVDSLVELDDSLDGDARPFFFEAYLEVCPTCYNSVISYMESPDQPDFHLQALLMPQKLPASGRTMRSSQLPPGLLKPSKIDLEWSRTFQQDGTPRRLPALPSRKSGTKRGNLMSESQSSIGRLSTGSALSAASSRKKSRFMSPRVHRIKSSPRSAPVSELKREDSLKSASNDDLLAEMERRNLLATRITPHAPSHPHSSASRSGEQEGVCEQEEEHTEHEQASLREHDNAAGKGKSEPPQAPNEGDTLETERDVKVPEDLATRHEQEERIVVERQEQASREQLMLFESPLGAGRGGGRDQTIAATEDTVEEAAAEVPAGRAEETEPKENEPKALEGGMTEGVSSEQPAPTHDQPGQKEQEGSASKPDAGSEDVGPGERERTDVKAPDEPHQQQPEPPEQKALEKQQPATKYDWPGKKKEGECEPPLAPHKGDTLETERDVKVPEAPSTRHEQEERTVDERQEQGRREQRKNALFSPLGGGKGVGGASAYDWPGRKRDQTIAATEDTVVEAAAEVPAGRAEEAEPKETEPKALAGGMTEGVSSEQPAPTHDQPGQKEQEPSSPTANDGRKEYRPSSEKTRLEASDMAQPEISDEFTFESSAGGEGSVDEVPSGVETSASLDGLEPMQVDSESTASQPAETIPDPEEEKAATAIQSRMRGMMERKAVQERKSLQDAEKESRKRDTAGDGELGRASSNAQHIRREASMPSVGEEMDEAGAQKFGVKLGHEGMNPQLHDGFAGMDEEKAAVAIQSGMRGMMERKALNKAKRPDSPRPDEMGDVATQGQDADVKLPAANQAEGQAASASLDTEKAVVAIQSGMRGMRDRQSARSLREKEQEMQKEQEEMRDAMMLQEQQQMEAQMFQDQRLGSELFGENSEPANQSMSTEQLQVNQMRQTAPIQPELSFSSYSSVWSQGSVGSVAESVTSSVYPQDSGATATSATSEPTETVSTQSSVEHTSDPLDGGPSSTVFPIPEDSVPDPTTASVQGKGSFRSGGELRSQRYREAQGTASSSGLQPSAPHRPKAT